MTEVEQVLRATLTERDDDPAVLAAVSGLAAGARRRAERRRKTRIAAGGAAAGTVLVIGLTVGVVGIRDAGAPAAAPSVPAATMAPRTGASVDRSGLDRTFRAVWPEGRQLLLVSSHAIGDESWEGYYRYPAGTEYPTEVRIELERPGRPPTPAELDPCRSPVGAVRTTLCSPGVRPDGSKYVSYETQETSGRRHTSATVLTLFRADGHHVTVSIGISTDDGSWAMADWALGPDDFLRVAADPRLTLAN